MIHLEESVDEKELSLCAEDYFGRPLAVCFIEKTPGQIVRRHLVQAPRFEEGGYFRYFTGGGPIIRVRERDPLQCTQHGGPLYPVTPSDQTPVCLYGVYIGNWSPDTKLGQFVRVSEKRDWILYNMGLAVALRSDELIQLH